MNPGFILAIVGAIMALAALVLSFTMGRSRKRRQEHIMTSIAAQDAILNDFFEFYRHTTCRVCGNTVTFSAESIDD